MKSSYVDHFKSWYKSQYLSKSKRANINKCSGQKRKFCESLIQDKSI